MKILYLVHQFFPEHYTGTEKFVLNTAKMAQKNGHKVKVVTYSFYDPSLYERSHGNILYREFDYDGLHVLAFRHRTIPPAIHIQLGDPELTGFAEHVLMNERPEIVHVGHPMRVGEFIKVARSFGLPYLVTMTDFYYACPKGIMQRTDTELCDSPHNGVACHLHCRIPGMDRRLAEAKDILSTAALRVAPSAFVAGMMQRELGLKVYVLHHGISYNEIINNQRVYQPGDPLTFFYGGSLSRHKGVHLAIEAFSRIKSSHIRLKIYGSGHDQPYIQHLHGMAGADPRIEMCGVFTEDQVGDIFPNVDVAIVPSVWYENYPLVLHEALASKVPVITSNVGGMAEKIQDGVNGFTFVVGDSADLTRKLQFIVDHPEILNDLKRNMNSQMVPTIEQEAFEYDRIYHDFARPFVVRREARGHAPAQPARRSRKNARLRKRRRGRGKKGRMLRGRFNKIRRGRAGKGRRAVVRRTGNRPKVRGRRAFAVKKIRTRRKKAS